MLNKRTRPADLPSLRPEAVAASEIDGVPDTPDRHQVLCDLRRSSATTAGSCSLH